MTFSLRPIHSPVIRAALLWLVTSLASPVFGGNPYQGICQRNAFHLRPATSPKVEAPHEPLPRVRLTGIITILPGKRALLVVDFPTKPMQKPKEESYILTEGQRAGPIEVLAIDEKTEHVKIDDSGTVTNLTFEKITTPHVAARVQPVYQVGSRPYRRVYR